MDDFDISHRGRGHDGADCRSCFREHARLLTRAQRAGTRDRRCRTEPESPYEEIEQQNQELLKTLQELRARQEELNC